MARIVKLVAVCAVLAAVAAFAPGLVRTLTAQAVEAHDSTLAGARVSTLAGGRTVMSMEVSGDLRGMLTLSLDVAPDGTVTGGDWAVVVSYAEDLNPDGTVATEVTHDESESYPEYIRLVNKGTLGGSVIGGFLGSGSGGAVSLTNVQLELLSGSLEYSGVTAGWGNVDADLGLTDAQGTLRLAF